MSADQGVLALYCQEPGCAVELTYRGYGRPPRWCDDHYPSRAPARLPRPEPQHEVPAGVSGRPGVLLDAPMTAGRARATDPQSSVAAARTVDAAPLQARILAAYRQHARLTPYEVVDVLDEWSRQDTVRSAVGRLHKDRVLVETGETRPSPRGRPSMVLRLAEEG